MSCHKDYRIGWICALPLELAAAEAMLDRIHHPLNNPPGDKNVYVLGSIGHHHIVMTCLPSGLYGTTAATMTALRMQYSFQSIECCFLVGIGGGAPRLGTDIRLGDVVVSKPTAHHGGIIQYDYGKLVAGDRFILTGSLNKPSEMLLKTLSRLEAKHMLQGSQIETLYNETMSRYPLLQEKFKYPGQSDDRLFLAEYEHIGGDDCCEKCDSTMLQHRLLRPQTRPRVFYGLVASANRVMRDAKARDLLSHEHGILCFEMEAAGVVDIFPSLVVRGVCDYSDSHKNKRWQGYAAITAAAYTKELLLHLPSYEADVSFKALESAMPPCEMPFLGLVPEQRPTISDPGRSTPGPETRTIEEFSVEDIAKDALSKKEHAIAHLPSSVDTRPHPVDVLESLSSEMDSRRILEINLAMARHQRTWHPWPGDCVHVYHGVKSWLSSCQSFLLVLKSTPRASSRVKDLSVEIIDFLLRRKDSSTDPGDITADHAIFWIVSTADPVSNNPIDIVKSIIRQAFQQYPHFFQSEIVAKLKQTHEEDDMWRLLRLMLSLIPKAFIIFDSGSAEYTTKFLQIAEEIVSLSSPISAQRIKFLVTLCEGFIHISEPQGPNTRTVCVPTSPQVQSVRRQSRPGISWNTLAP